MFSLTGSEKSSPKFELKDWVLVKVTPSDPIRVAPGGRVELECTVFGSPIPQAQWSRGIQLNQVTRTSRSYFREPYRLSPPVMVITNIIGVIV